MELRPDKLQQFPNFLGRQLEQLFLTQQQFPQTPERLQHKQALDGLPLYDATDLTTILMSVHPYHFSTVISLRHVNMLNLTFLKALYTVAYVPDPSVSVRT